MTKSTKTYNEMGDVFIETGKTLRKLTEEHIAVVDMAEGKVKTKLDHLCGSPACVGGWLAVLYGKRNCSYEIGANLFAEKLGFVTIVDINNFRYNAFEYLQDFLYENPNLWGNRDGDEAFSQEYAYNEGNTHFDDELTIDDIAHKFICTGKRMKKASKSKKK